MSKPEVVVLGAGLAGMTAAHHLADRNVLVLEREQRVGGRTLSGQVDDYWYNLGAQYVWDPRTLRLCRDLGLDVLDAAGAKSALYLRGRLVRASNPYTLLLKMPLSLGEKVDFGRTITRLRRLGANESKLDARQLDAEPLSALVGRASPVTADIIDRICEGGVGLSMYEASGWIGLGYAIHLFGGNVNDTLKAVVGGTQQITKTIAARMKPEQLVLGAEVESISAAGDQVAVRYRRDGRTHEVEARACVCSLPAPEVLELMPDIPPAKRAALERMTPYTKSVAVAWVFDQTGPLPWDDLLSVPVLGGETLHQINHNTYFLRSRGRKVGSVLLTLLDEKLADQAWSSSDAAICDAQRTELKRIFPSAATEFDKAKTHVHRWPRVIPPFRKGWLGDRDHIRAPHGNVFFCGDYTAQPGTPGAVGSGYHAAAAAAQRLSGALSAAT